MEDIPAVIYDLSNILDNIYVFKYKMSVTTIFCGGRFV